eukprot:Tbor_TRINITY_DN1861_c0_g1::TRINITY_DN1861_c0_g1_i1::g.23080::m.23080/K14396/PABPN1, PABP2; polyadenylate-binding protein 2
MDEEIERMTREVALREANLNSVGGPTSYDINTLTQASRQLHTFSKDTDDRSIHVSNLPKGDNRGRCVTHEEVCEFFADCGQIQTCTLLKDRKTGAFNGRAYIEFASYEGHGKAMDTKQNANFAGHQITVEKKRSLYRPKFAGAAPRGRGGAPRGRGAMAGSMADPMAMFTMIAAAMGAAAGGLGAGTYRGRGRGRARGGNVFGGSQAEEESMNPFG